MQTTQQNLKHVLTDSERLQCSETQCELLEQKKLLEQKLKQVTKELKTAITHTELAIADIGDKLRDRCDIRPVKCLLLDRRQPGRPYLRYTVRLDTGHIVSARPLTEEELQMSLLEDPTPDQFLGIGEFRCDDEELSVVPIVLGLTQEESALLRHLPDVQLLGYYAEAV